jgi:cobalt/nickel transport system permease protein
MPPMTLPARDPTTPDSPLARWDPRWKLAAVLLAAFAVVSLQHPGPAAVAAAAALALAFLGRVPLSVIAGRAGLLLLATLPLVVFVPLTQGAGSPGWSVGSLHVSQPGLIAAAVVALRVLAVGLLALVLTRMAPLSRTLAAAHALRVPGVLVQVAQLAHRYTFVLAAEVRRLRVALRARGFRAGTNRHSYRTVGHVVGSLLVRGGDRADRVADAMRCRGFDGTYRTAAAFHTTTADALSFLAAAAGTITLVLIDRL